MYDTQFDIHTHINTCTLHIHAYTLITHTTHNHTTHIHIQEIMGTWCGSHGSATSSKLNITEKSRDIHTALKLRCVVYFTCVTHP